MAFNFNPNQPLMDFQNQQQQNLMQGAFSGGEQQYQPQQQAAAAPVSKFQKFMNVLGGVGTGAAAGGGMGGPMGAAIGALGGAIGPISNIIQQRSQAKAMRKEFGTPEEQMMNKIQEAMLMQTMQQQNPNQQVYQTPTRNKTQEGMQMAMIPRLMQDLYGGQTSFQPIAAEARRQFNEDTVPRLIARGSADGLTSSVEKGITAGSRQLESELAGQGAKFQQEQEMARQRILPQLMQLGLSPSFENMIGDEGTLNSPQTLENMGMDWGNKGFNKVQDWLGGPQEAAPVSDNIRATFKANPGFRKMYNTMDPQQKEQYSSIADRAVKPKLFGQLSSPESVRIMHSLLSSASPLVTSLATRIDKMPDLMKLSQAFQDRDTPEIFRLSQLYKMNTSTKKSSSRKKSSRRRK